MAAFKVKLVLTQGETFWKTFTWKVGQPAAPVDLTGCTALMHVRRKITDAATLIELSTGNGRIELGGPTGAITLKLSAAETAALNFAAAVYDLELTFADNTVRRLIEGSVTLKPEVTRA